MRTLFLDIASQQGSIALLTESEVIASADCGSHLRDHELIPLYQELLSKANWTHADLTHVVCVRGPGGFTSLRIAATFANTLQAELGLEACGVHLSDLLYAQVQAEDLLWLHSTKKDALFIRGFGVFADKWPEAQLISYQNALDTVPENAVWTGELIEAHEELQTSKQLQAADRKSVINVLPEYCANLEYSAKPIEPWYGREG